MAKPIIPCAPSMIGEGPHQDMTTQKHDFVMKPFSKRSRIMPSDLMPKTCDSLSSKTVNRLSYLTPDMERFCKTVSFKPIACYVKPEGEFSFVIFSIFFKSPFLVLFVFSSNGSKYNTKM